MYTDPDYRRKGIAKVFCEGHTLSGRKLCLVHYPEGEIWHLR